MPTAPPPAGSADRGGAVAQRSACSAVVVLEPVAASRAAPAAAPAGRQHALVGELAQREPQREPGHRQQRRPVQHVGRAPVNSRWSPARAGQVHRPGDVVLEQEPDRADLVGQRDPRPCTARPLPSWPPTAELRPAAPAGLSSPPVAGRPARCAGARPGRRPPRPRPSRLPVPADVGQEAVPGRRRLVDGASPVSPYHPTADADSSARGRGSAAASARAQRLGRRRPGWRRICLLVRLGPPVVADADAGQVDHGVARRRARPGRARGAAGSQLTSSAACRRAADQPHDRVAVRAQGRRQRRADQPGGRR